MDKQMIVKPIADAEYVSKMRQAIKDNDGYCPCRVEKTADTKCICREFREQLGRKEVGKCHCGLYEVVTG